LGYCGTIDLDRACRGDRCALGRGREVADELLSVVNTANNHRAKVGARTYRYSIVRNREADPTDTN